MIKPLMKWLPQPNASDIDYSRNLSKKNIDVDSLVRLAQLDWDAGGLRRLAGYAARMRQSAEAGRGNLHPVRALIFCNATAKHLTETLVGTGIRHGLLLDTMIAEYEEPEAFLVRNRESVIAFAPDIAIVALDVHAFALRPMLGDADAADEAAGRVVARLRAVRDQLRAALGKPVVFQTITPDPEQSRLHVDRFVPGSHKDLVNRTNAKIADFVGDSGELVLDVAAIAATVGLDNWTSARHWALAKYQFAPDMAPLYAEHLARLIGLRLGKSRRVLVLDLDNTLWGGIVGDDGKENLVLGPGSPVGEAHCAIQWMAKSLRERGIVLCVSSKNEESVALDAFRTHPEMVLDEQDIAVFQINWKDKAANLTALSQILNLGLDSFVFLDDNPAERAQIRFALPEVAVPELPNDVTEWLAVFQAACYFETTGFTQEDRERAGYYRANAMRAAQLQSSAGQEDYLRSLDMEMEIASFDAVGRKRIAQLIAKSNQFNLTTKRYSEADVAAAESDPKRIALQIRLRDIFGDNGMISVVIADRRENSLDIETWLMSCRVLGRGVPEAVLDWLVAEARRLGKRFIRGTFIPTKKNMMVAGHYRVLGFDLVDEKPDATTYWQLSVDGYRDKQPPIRVLDRIVAE
jgi:FkbH-like protein